MSTPIVGRIGRAPAPGEAAIQQLRERPDVLEYMARTAFAGERGLTPLDGETAWLQLSVAERAQWLDATFASIAEGAEQYDASRPTSPPNPDDGGQGQRPEAEVDDDRLANIA
jgi:hypothetical protein